MAVIATRVARPELAWAGFIAEVCNYGSWDDKEGYLLCHAIYRSSLYIAIGQHDADAAGYLRLIQHILPRLTLKVSAAILYATATNCRALCEEHFRMVLEDMRNHTVFRQEPIVISKICRDEFLLKQSEAVMDLQTSDLVIPAVVAFMERTPGGQETSHNLELYRSTGWSMWPNSMGHSVYVAVQIIVAQSSIDLPVRPETIQMTYRDSVAGVAVAAYTRFMHDHTCFGSASKRILRAISGRQELPGMEYPRMLQANPFVYQDFNRWSLYTSGGEEYSIWSPLAVFVTRSSDVVLSTISIVIDVRNCRVTLTSLSHQQHRTRQNPAVELLRKMENERAGMIIQPKYLPLIYEVMAYDCMEVISPLGCISQLITRYRAGFSLPLLQLAAVAHACSLETAVWLVKTFVGSEVTDLPWTGTPITLPSAAEQAWEILAAYPKELGLREYTLEDTDTDFIDALTLLAINRTTDYLPSSHNGPVGILTAPGATCLVGFSLLGWVCAYTAIFRVVGINSNIPIRLSMMELDQLPDDRRRAFEAGFERLLAWGVMHAILGTKGICDLYSPTAS
jgi:hypothetical protein